MPVKVKCNSCGEELMLPDGAGSKQFSCPRCRGKFTHTGGSVTQSVSSVSMKAPPAPPPAPSAAGKSSVSRSDEEFVSYIEGPDGAGTSKPAAGSTTALVPAGRTAVVEAAPKPASANTASTNSARFIIADATARKIELGASGQLPSLVLDEAQKKAAPEEKTEGSKTWLLLAAVLGSVGLSVVMLFFDATGGGGDSSGKSTARRHVLQRYVQGLPPTRPCQPYLARAIQAYNRNDTAEERRLYRHVLDLLHSEGKDPNEGVTGAIQSDTLPNDKELEELISKLLRE